VREGTAEALTAKAAPAAVEEAATVGAEAAIAVPRKTPADFAD
jgi:hypothetical protein